MQATIGHSTTPQSNTQLTGTTALTNSYRSLYVQYGQTFITGTSMYFTIGDSRNDYNSGYYLLNPSQTGYLDMYFTQPLLQGLSRSVNNRDIKVAKNNQKVTDIQVKLQVVTTVSAVLNLYWDLVSFNDAVRIKEQALKTAQNLYEGNKKQVAIGAMAGIEVTRAAAEVSQSKEDLLIAQTNVQQQEIVLKNALNRNGMQNTWLDDVHIVPLDHIEIPKADEVRPVQDLVEEALTHREEIEQSKINLESSADHAQREQERRCCLRSRPSPISPTTDWPGRRTRSSYPAWALPTLISSGGRALLSRRYSAAISRITRPAFRSTFLSGTGRRRRTT